jgi:uncharacterized protein (DUF1501 family)
MAPQFLDTLREMPHRDVASHCDFKESFMLPHASQPRLSPIARTSGAAARLQLPRRRWLQLGLGGFTSLSLTNLLRLQAAETPTPRSGNSKPKTAIILVWLRGGASHLDTFDPKPMAPLEYRGPFRTLRTNVTGIELTELLPRLAAMADKYALVRSLTHNGGGHPAGSLQVLSGDPDAQDKPGPRYPDWMSIAKHLRGEPNHDLPNYVTLNPVDNYDNFVIAGSTYLGPAADPFSVSGNFGDPAFRVPNIGLDDAAARQRLVQRVQLRRALDGWRRGLDQHAEMHAMDSFESQAVNLLTSPQAAAAFDLSREPDTIRERYGYHAWGQQCLMARRLVEAGVEIVTTEFDGPLCGRVANWDDHAVNHHVFDALSFRAPYFDQAVSALIEDVHQRGLAERVMVVVTGEFGRTPRISHVASSGGGVASAAAGVVQPGRDHWPQAGSMLFAGGGIRGGQVIGATDRRGELPVERRVTPEDFLATLYQHLRIDFENATIEDFTGRPTPIIREGQPIRELWS